MVKKLAVFLTTVLVAMTFITGAVSAHETDAARCVGLAEGASFLSADGCNSCSCSNGSVQCTELACSPAQSVSCLANQITVHAELFDNYCAAGSVFAPTEQLPIVGCVEGDMICVQKITYARRDSDSQLFTFANGCLPEGFTESRVVSGCPSSPVAVHEEVACLANQITVHAELFDNYCAAGSVFAPTEQLPVVGCVDRDLICVQKITYARRDSDSQLFTFANGCLPEGFTESRVVSGCPSSPVAVHEEITCLANERIVYGYNAVSMCDVRQANVPANRIALGCVAMSSECRTEVSFATSPSGEDVLVTESCLPSGFTPLGASCGEVEVRAECRAKQQRPVRATPRDTYCADPEHAFDANTGQQLHAVTVGCVATDMMCVMKATAARWTDGQVHVFADGCMPEGFVVDASLAAAELCPAQGAESAESAEDAEDAEDAVQCVAGQERVRAVRATEACGDSGEAVHEAGAVLESVGCLPREALCLLQTTYAVREADGTAFVFASSCVPEGFRVLAGVASCDALACADAATACAATGGMCMAQEVECFTTPCMLQPVCTAAPECAGRRVDEAFVLPQPIPDTAYTCNVDCLCRADGSLQCAPCPTALLNAAAAAAPSDGPSDSASAAVYASGAFGVAAAAVGLFAGYRKYARRDDKHPLIPSLANPNYKSFVATNV